MNSYARNIEVFKQTRELSKTKFLEDTVKSIEGTVVYKEPQSLKVRGKSTQQIIDFKNNGTIAEGLFCLGSKKRVGILNFADGLTPGGLVLQGESTQEEDICRCTNLYETLIKPECMKNYYQYNYYQQNGLYSNTVIYSPDVRVIRYDSTYSFLEKEAYLDVLTCPSPSIRVSEEVLCNRILGILKVARANKIKVLVLGAWGCGAFGQDAFVMGRCFAKAINKCNYFDYIMFAVKEVNRYADGGNLDKLCKGFYSV